MKDTGILLDWIAKALAQITELSRYSKSLPNEKKAPFLEALKGISRSLEQARPAGEELERLASFPVLNPQPVMQIDLRTGQVDYLNPAGELLFPELRAAGIAHVWLSGLGQEADGVNRPDARVFSRDLKIGDKWFEQDIIVARDAGGLRVYGREITARRNAEEALRESEIRYRTLFETMTEGFSLGEIIYDEAGRPCDLRYLVINPAFERQTGLKVRDVIGRTGRELFPDAEPDWLGRFAKVARTGEPDHFEGWFGPLGKYFDVYVFQTEPGRFGVIFTDITERKRTEQDLAASRNEALNEKKRLEAVMEALPVGVAIVDARGGNIRANRAFDDIWGTPRPAARTVDDYSAYRAWWADSGEPVKPEEWASARAVREGRAVVGQTMRIERFGGNEAYVINSAAPIFDAEGKVIGSTVAIQDITKRILDEESLRRAHEELEIRVKERTGELKKALEALGAERQRFHDVLDMLPAYVVLLTPDYRVPFVNRFFKERFGESGGRRCYEFLFDRNTPCPDCETYKVLKTLKPHRWEWTGPDGRDYDISDFPFTDGDGSRLILEMGIDITKRKKAEEERLRLATAVEQIADGVAIMDAEGRILSANPAFGIHHALRPQELVGRSLRDFLEIDAGDHEIVGKLQETLDSGKSWNCRLRRVREGRVREVDLAVSPIRDTSGRLINAIAVERDVTQEVVVQERIRQWQKMEALGTLAGGIAHDFNNILLPILINTELMLAGERADGPEAHRLSQVLEAARRGKDMVKQIIAFARQREQERSPVEIPPLIRESIRLLRVSIPKSIEISEKIEIDSAMAVADPTQIHQILMNLGSNAAHAMREKGGILEIGLSETFLDEDTASQHIGLKPGSYLRLTVRDTGQGMGPDVRARIFEPFFTTKKLGEGTGMGLAVVHGIVKSHGGAISIASDLGKGTTVTIYLPRIVGAQPVSEEKRGPFPGGTERILFVDDEDIQVRAMTKLLEHLGYRVAGFSDSRKALDAFRSRPDAFDLVITDQTMPHMSGGELAREILRVRPGLPVILCTGYSETLNENDALAMGVKAFLPKPFSVKEIAEAIRRTLPSAP